MGQPWPTNSESPSGPETGPGAPPAGQPQPARRRRGLVVAGLAGAVLLAGAGGFALGRSSADGNESPIAAAESAAASQVRLKDAYDRCFTRDTGSTLTLADGGDAIVVDTGSEYGSTTGMDCVLADLDTKQSIIAQMSRTTAMMGVQDAEDDGLAYSWSYHPDNGVNMVIEYAEAKPPTD
jgi:hypothetical protein